MGFNKWYRLSKPTLSEAGVGGRDRLIQLTVGYAQPAKDNCNGYFVSTTCNITEAVVEYHVELSRQTVTLNNPSLKLNVVALSNDQACWPPLGKFEHVQFECNLIIRD